MLTNHIREMHNIDGLVQERRNSSALAMELCFFCTNPSIHPLIDNDSHLKTIGCAMTSSVEIFFLKQACTNAAY